VCAELRDSELLGELLHMVLAAGNFLNAVSISQLHAVLNDECCFLFTLLTCCKARDQAPLYHIA